MNNPFTEISKVIVLNRKQCIALTQNEFHIDRAIISISSVNSDTPQFSENPTIKHILKLHFNDEEEGSVAMTPTDARRIASFVKTCKNDVEQFVVHCDAGVSRSAGVAAAIMKYLTGDDSKIFDNQHYCPNMNCYRLTLTELYKYY